MVLMLFASKNKKDKHEKFYISRKNEDLFQIMDKLKLSSDYSDKICQYIRMGVAIEKTCKKNKITVEQALKDKDFLAAKLEESKPKAIPRLDEYHEKGIQGKTVSEAVEKRLISPEQAGKIIVSAHEIIVEAKNTGNMWRYLPEVKSKRDLRKKFKIKRLFSTVKQCIEEVFPLAKYTEEEIKTPFVSPNKEFEQMMDSGEYEILPDKPFYRYDYNLTYNSPS
jgi:hypothetical protein